MDQCKIHFSWKYGFFEMDVQANSTLIAHCCFFYKIFSRTPESALAETDTRIKKRGTTRDIKALALQSKKFNLFHRVCREISTDGDGD
jgi:hypothetical protein